MNLKQKASDKLKGGNVAALLAVKEEPLVNSMIWPLAFAIAEMMDDIAKGKNMYMSIGSTMKRDMYTISFKLDGEATSMYAESLPQLAEACLDVVSPF